MTNVVKLGDDRQNAIAEVRQSAVLTLEWLIRQMGLAQKYRKQIQAAKTVERVVYSYARWLGTYYKESYVPRPYIRLIGKDIHVEAHRSAVDAMGAEMDRISHIVAIGTPWRSLPNLMHTKFAASELLGRVIAALEKAIGCIQILQGQQTEKQA
ncbi:hypothetical protein SFHH103_02719 [Sinorhizobium fredii HH103]|uniref:Uncharacterized protein n=1 Tax=Sinorhizobium fredii (strain HH103) TaxID=1117943 RepID=G9ABC3_SINF1|nr:hypothetical protein [Sinorhizobium fredii]CCE97214.1 hypothetical protein SFHH103_02719 [Sinorhizobium fredii HH103]